jgi:hypothetical protein
MATVREEAYTAHTDIRAMAEDNSREEVGVQAWHIANAHESSLEEVLDVPDAHSLTHAFQNHHALDHEMSLISH